MSSPCGGYSACVAPKAMAEDFWKDWPELHLKATSADYYFESYNHYGVHEDIFQDGVTIPAFQQAITQSRSVYGFRPMRAADVARAMATGRNEADLERARRGLGAARAAGVAAQQAAPADPNAPPPVPPDARTMVWVLAEFVPGRKIGEKLIPPLGSPQMNGWGLMDVTDSDNHTRPCLIRQIDEAGIGQFCDERIGLARSSESCEGDDRIAGEDVRTLTVTYGMNGERHRGFRETVKELTMCDFEDFPLQPRTSLEYCRAIASVAESATAQHHVWASGSRIPEGDRSLFEDEVLARILDAAIMYDCLNISNLACIELVCRRRQLLAEAHSASPAAPSYMGAEHFMGQTYKAGGGIVVPSLTDYVLDRSVCRDVQRRVLRRGQLAKRANQAILALNSLFSGESFGHDSGVVDDLSVLPLFQQHAISDIISAVSRLGAPLHDSGPGALSTLRAAGSSYCEAKSGVGDVVPLAFSDLSLPSKGVVGVDLLEALDAPLRAMVDDFEGAMLQDSSVWTAVSRDASHLKPYSDPCLKHRKNFLRFVQLLYDRGLVGFTSKHRGFVGAFSVAKKNKIVDGVVKKRQRLVLDCRQTNQLFRPSPYTQLGSLASLCKLQLPSGQQLYLSGADIQDCFYAVHIPEKMQEFFCLEGWLDSRDIYKISGGALQFDESRSYVPCFTVLPMGFSWSFYLVQQIHQSAVCRSLDIPESSLLRDGFPAPKLEEGQVLSMPYCDNIHSISMDPGTCNAGKQKIVGELARLGFAIHEEEDAALTFETLGGEVDGVAGEVRMTRRRAWAVIRAFEYVADHPVSPATIQRLLGHAMFFSTLNRNGMAVFRKLYDFVERGGAARMLNASESRECKIFAGIVPLLFASIRRPWSDEVLCSDASPDGHGLCSRHLPMNVIDSIGRWNERWRYKRLEPEFWQPRQRALGLDLLGDVGTVMGDNIDEYDDNYIINNDEFPEVPKEVLVPSCWKTTLMGKWRDTSEHITVKEGRALVLCLKRLCRSLGNRNKRHLIFVDNLALALCIPKGRAKNFAMLRISQQVSALSLVGSFSIRLRWVPSEFNPADGPSRGQIHPGAYTRPGSCSPADHREAAGWYSVLADAEAKDTWTMLNPKLGKQRGPVESRQEAGCQSAEGEEGLGEELFAAQETDHQDSCGRGGRHWSQGSDKSSDSIGDEIGFCGSEEPVPAVPSQIREFLPGQRVAVAPRRPVRHDTRRLPGHILPGGQISCGRRKSGSGGGI
eukprot:s2848_g2.t1